MCARPFAIVMAWAGQTSRHTPQPTHSARFRPGRVRSASAAVFPSRRPKVPAPRAEIRPRPMLDDPEIRAGKGRGIPRNAELRRVERRQAALGRCAQRRHILRLQPDE